MDKLLLDEHPLLVMPKLAEKIGLNEAIILQQVHYWNETNKRSGNNLKDGHYWTFNSYEGWQKQFPFWSISTIKRTITNLEKQGLLIVSNYNKLKIDRTKWYRINYETLETVGREPKYQNDPTNSSKWPEQNVKMNKPLPEINSENNSENNSSSPTSDKSEGCQLTEVYKEAFREYFGCNHRNISKPVEFDTDIGKEEFKVMAYKFFSEYGTGSKAENLEKCSIDNFAKHLVRYEKFG